MLCANGGGSPAGLAQAVFAYNHSPAYVAQVLSLSAAYSRTPPGSASPAGEAAAGYALAQVGTPYVWGGAEPGGFDCSGLVHFAYGLAGVALPRLAQAQYDAGRHLSSGEPLSEGDLVFFGEGPSAVDHVGIYVGDGRMVDAPHTGATVRVEPVAGFSPPYVGATDPTDRGAGP
jgi:cell wall-associated NlpC family hydrolase